MMSILRKFLIFNAFMYPILSFSQIEIDKVKVKYDSILYQEDSFYGLNNLLKLSSTNNSFFLPHFGYYINSNNQMYLKTGDVKYLRFNYKLIKSNLKKINDFKLVAPSNNQNIENGGKEFILFEGYYFRYVSQFFYIVKRDNIQEFTDIDIYINRLKSRVNLWKKRSYNRYDSDYMFHKNVFHIWAMWIHTFIFMSEIDENFSVDYEPYILDFFKKFEGSIYYNNTLNLPIWNVYIRTVKTVEIPDISHANHIVSLYFDLEYFKLRKVSSKYSFFKDIFIHFNQQLKTSKNILFIDGLNHNNRKSLTSNYFQSDGWMKYLNLDRKDNVYKEACYSMFKENEEEIKKSYLYIQFLSNFYKVSYDFTNSK